MSKGKERRCKRDVAVGRDARAGSFIVDKQYVKTQAREAVTQFLVPVSGVYTAVVGNKRPRTTVKEKIR